MPNRLAASRLTGVIALALALVIATVAGLGAPAAAQDDAPGSLTILTVNGDDEPVPGACYHLFVDEDGPTDFVAEQCDAYDGDIDGTTGFADLPAGDFVVVQIFVPAGYKTGQDRSIAVLAGEETTYAFRTPRGGQTIALALRDDGEQPLPGGCYGLFPVNGGPVAKVACDYYDGADDGATQISGVEQGSYVVILSSPPEGYTIPTGQRADIGGDGLDLVFDVALGGETVTIRNIDDAGESVTGACHRLYTDAGDGTRGDLVADRCDWSDGAVDGSIVVDGLLPGPYLIADPAASSAAATGDDTAGVATPSATPVAPADIPFEVVEGEGAEVEVISPSPEAATPAA